MSRPATLPASRVARRAPICRASARPWSPKARREKAFALGFGFGDSRIRERCAELRMLSSIAVLQLKNLSPFAATLGVLPDAAGVDTLYVIVKGTFSLAARIAVHEEQMAPTFGDVYWAEPGMSSLRYAAELHLAKPGTDVVLNGSARTDRPRESRMVTLSAAGRQKHIQVFGDRVWTASGKPSAPKPFLEMPLVYERAFGGVDRAPDGTIADADEHNPVGVGFAPRRSKDGMIGRPLPNLEDPEHLLGELGDRAPPACAGFVSASWLPRRLYAGTYDAHWQKTRAPYLPEDFRPQFFHAGCPEMTFQSPLRGGERISIQGVSEHGDLRFVLPQCELHVSARIAGRVQKPPAQLETVLVESEFHRVVLTWRAAVPCDKRPLKIDVVSVALSRLDVEPSGS